MLQGDVEQGEEEQQCSVISNNKEKSQQQKEFTIEDMVLGDLPMHHTSSSFEIDFEKLLTAMTLALACYPRSEWGKFMIDEKRRQAMKDVVKCLLRGSLKEIKLELKLIEEKLKSAQLRKKLFDSAKISNAHLNVNKVTTSLTQFLTPWYTPGTKQVLFTCWFMTKLYDCSTSCYREAVEKARILGSDVMENAKRVLDDSKNPCAKLNDAKLNLENEDLRHVLKDVFKIDDDDNNGVGEQRQIKAFDLGIEPHTPPTVVLRQLRLIEAEVEAKRELLRKQEQEIEDLKSEVKLMLKQNEVIEKAVEVAYKGQELVTLMFQGTNERFFKTSHCLNMIVKMAPKAKANGDLRRVLMSALRRYIDNIGHDRGQNETSDTNEPETSRRLPGVGHVSNPPLTDGAISTDTDAIVHPTSASISSVQAPATAGAPAAVNDMHLKTAVYPVVASASRTPKKKKKQKEAVALHEPATGTPALQPTANVDKAAAISSQKPSKPMIQKPHTAAAALASAVPENLQSNSSTGAPTSTPLVPIEYPIPPNQLCQSGWIQDAPATANSSAGNEILAAVFQENLPVENASFSIELSSSTVASAPSELLVSNEDMVNLEAFDPFGEYANIITNEDLQNFELSSNMSIEDDIEQLNFL